MIFWLGPFDVCFVLKHIQLKHKQYAKQFNNVNALQKEGGPITMNHGLRIYQLLSIVFQHIY